MTQTPSGDAVQAQPPLHKVPLDELRRCYPSSELLTRPVLNEAGAQVGRIEDLMMMDDHLAYAIMAVGDFVGVPGRRVVVAIEDLSIVDKEFMLRGATPATVGELTIYDRGFASQEGVLLHRARHRVKETGHIVSGALGEPMPGAITDTSNGLR
ncbi:MAG TPA: PRC-barrel domain-containing protein [Phenylobacterium sp.]|nr:PRC-barrel domain-containing protein [Phenylobacterium sp.]